MGLSLPAAALPCEILVHRFSLNSSTRWRPRVLEQIASASNLLKIAYVAVTGGARRWQPRAPPWRSFDLFQPRDLPCCIDKGKTSHESCVRPATDTSRARSLDDHRTMVSAA